MPRRRASAAAPHRLRCGASHPPGRRARRNADLIFHET